MNAQMEMGLKEPYYSSTAMKTMPSGQSSSKLARIQGPVSKSTDKLSSIMK